MPPSNGEAVVGQQAKAAKRPAQGRIVPAVPLAFSKGKSARPPPKPEAVARAEAAVPLPVSDGVASGKTEERVREAEHDTHDLPGTTQARAVDDEETAEEAQVTRPAAETPVSRGSAPMSVSDGSTPDRSTFEPAPTSTPPANGAAETSSPTAAASPASSRKPVERFDMRQIRTELPPAFVPFAEQQYTPHSAASSQSQPQPTMLPHAHPTHPSASSIVFGGHDSSASSPAPPLSGSAFMPPQQPGPPPFYSHGHHASESQAQRLYHPGYPQSQAPWGIRHGFAPSAPQSFYHPHAHPQFRYPPREPFTPAAIPLLNGHGPRSRTVSRSSTAPTEAQKAAADLQSPFGLDSSVDSAKAMFPEPKAAFPGQHRHHTSHAQQQHMPPPPNYTHPEIASSIDNAESLRSHMLHHFRDPELADCHLQISENEGDGRQYLEGHKLILARSPTLLSMIRDSEAPAAATLKTQVHVRLTGHYVRVSSFMDAVRYLYGGALPSFDLYNSAPNLTSEERMDLAIQHIGTGAWLSVAAIAHRGVEIAGSLLQWNTIPAALAFALDGGLGQMWPIEDGSEERTSTCSSDDSLTKPESGGSPTHDPYASGLLHRIIDFTVRNLPSNFYLNPASPQLASSPRLPAALGSHESKSSRSDPRLSKIRFGEMSVEDHQRPSFATTAISSILLSLPFPLLKFLLEHPILSERLGPETVASIMRQVVAEREVRRNRALKGRLVNRPYDGTDAHLVQNLYWEESVEATHITPQHRTGCRLVRKRCGIDTPPSSGASGAESERNK